MVKWSDYRRGLCLLDPYGLDLSWEVVRQAGQMRSIELFLNYPVMDINRNLVRDNPLQIEETQLSRMDQFWGDRSWFDLIYGTSSDLFGNEVTGLTAKAQNRLPKAYRSKLREEAGFGYVPAPMLMRDTNGHLLYFLFFASHKPVAEHIVNDIFHKWSKPR